MERQQGEDDGCWLFKRARGLGKSPYDGDEHFSRCNELGRRNRNLGAKKSSSDTNPRLTHVREIKQMALRLTSTFDSAARLANERDQRGLARSIMW